MVQNQTSVGYINLIQAGRDLGAIGGGTFSTSAIAEDNIKLSYLEFRYYTDAAGSYKKRFMPFICGDATVTESRKANYINHTPISRNTSIPFYVGSESRIFKVSYEMIPSFLLQAQNKELIALMKKSLQYLETGSNDSNTEQQKFIIGNSQPDVAVFGGGFLDDGGNDKYFSFNYIKHQIDLVRSSVINNSIQPVYGPPLVRLNYGLLYQNIPCICLDYNVEQQYQDTNKRKYDTKYKITEYRIVLTFTLQEVRNGNFLSTPFSTTDAVAQDNIVGWEQIVAGNSLDPITPILKN